MPSGPKSIDSLIAGLRASGNGCASSTTPTRMSTRPKSSQLRLAPPAGSAGNGKGGQRGERGARVVVENDALRGVALVGHGLGAPLVEPDPVTVAASHEPRHRALHRDREERALERVVAD